MEKEKETKERKAQDFAAEYLQALEKLYEREEESLRRSRELLAAQEKAPGTGYLHEMLELARPRPPRAGIERLRRQAKAAAVAEALALAGKSLGALAGVPQRPADTSLLGGILEQRRKLEASYIGENRQYRQTLLSEAARREREERRGLRDETAALRRQAEAAETRRANLGRLQAQYLETQARAQHERQLLADRQRHDREMAALRAERKQAAAPAPPENEIVFSYYDNDGNEVRIDRTRFNTIAARIPEDELYQSYAANRSKQAQAGAMLNAVVRIDRQMRAEGFGCGNPKKTAAPAPAAGTPRPAASETPEKRPFAATDTRTATPGFFPNEPYRR